MAVISPSYGVMTFLAVLCGIGGSVMMSMEKGRGEEEKGNACFTAAVVLMGIITAALWVLLLLFRVPVFTLFGANAEIMPKTLAYGKWIIWFLPAFVFSTFMGAFIRNDGAPRLAMAAVIIGGSLNVFGDWFLVFPMKLGMTGGGACLCPRHLRAKCHYGRPFFQENLPFKARSPQAFSARVPKDFSNWDRRRCA